MEDPSFLSTHWIELDKAMNEKNRSKYKVKFHSLSDKRNLMFKMQWHDRDYFQSNVSENDFIREPVI